MITERKGTGALRPTDATSSQPRFERSIIRALVFHHATYSLAAVSASTLVGADGFAQRFCGSAESTLSCSCLPTLSFERLRIIGWKPADSFSAASPSAVLPAIVQMPLSVLDSHRHHDQPEPRECTLRRRRDLCRRSLVRAAGTHRTDPWRAGGRRAHPGLRAERSDLLVSGPR